VIEFQHGVLVIGEETLSSTCAFGFSGSQFPPKFRAFRPERGIGESSFVQLRCHALAILVKFSIAHEVVFLKPSNICEFVWGAPGLPELERAAARHFAKS
jgi:hypothetical protein